MSRRHPYCPKCRKALFDGMVDYKKIPHSHKRCGTIVEWHRPNIPTASVESVVDTLNQAIEADGDAIQKMFEFRVRCKGGEIPFSTKIPDEERNNLRRGEDRVDRFTIEFITLLNAALGCDGDSPSKIIAVYRCVCPSGCRVNDGDETCKNCSRPTRKGPLERFELVNRKEQKK